MQITDNIPGHWDRQLERERETRIERRTYTRTISYNIAEQWEKYSDKKRDKHGWRDVHRHLQWVIKIAWHCYTHLETKREKQLRIKRRTYTGRITDNTPDRQSERERNADQDTYLFTYNQWQYSWTVIEVFREKERERETRIKRRKYTPTMSDNTAEHYNRYAERKRKINTIKRRIGTYNQL